MRILTITSDHPPHHAGGYELRVKDIMNGLSARGHEVLILSTKPKKKLKSKRDGSTYIVKRLLHDRNQARFFPKELFFDIIDTRVIEKNIKEFHPDVIYLGHTYILSKAILPYLAGLKIPIIYDEGGNGLKGAWTEHGRWFRFCGDYQPKIKALSLVKPAVIKLVLWLAKDRIQQKWCWPEGMKVIFNSQSNLDHSLSFGVPANNAKVIHSGIDLDKFHLITQQQFEQPIRIICPGRLEQRKGQLDAIKLIDRLMKIGINATLTLVGKSYSKNFLERLNFKVSAIGLQKQVRILGMINQEEMVRLYQNSDICFFTSKQKAGFSRTPLEAMACGSIVISYGNEGSNEIIIDGENGFVVNEGSIEDVAAIIRNLVNSPKIVSRIITNARKTVEDKFNLEKYILNVEDLISKQVCSKVIDERIS